MHIEFQSTFSQGTLVFESPEGGRSTGNSVDKFEFVINLEAAKVLGLYVPNSIQLLADEMIE